MAETTEKIHILDLEIDETEALNSLTQLNQQINGLKDDIKDLNKEQKELEKTGKQNGTQYNNNAKQIESNKIRVNELSKEYRTQQKVVQDVIRGNQRELGTIEKLTQRNKELRQTLRELDLETEEGQKQRNQIIEEINENSDAIYQNSDAYVQNKMNIGNYQDALTNLNPKLKGMVSGFKGVTQAAKAFIATPVGLILAAIAAALAVMGKALKSSQGLMDEISVGAKKMSTAFDVVLDRVGNGMEKAFKKLKEKPKEAVMDLGNAIVTNLANRVKALPQIFIKAFNAVKNAIKGNKEEAIKDLEELGLAFNQFTTGLDPEQTKKAVEGIKSITEEIKEEAAIAAELRRQEIALREADIALTTQREELRKQIEANKLATRDETLTIQERLDAQDRAIALEKQLLDIELANARERAKIKEEELALGKSTAEQRQELANLQAEVIRLESSYLTRSKELVSERNSLNNQLIANEKARADAVKQALLDEAQAKQEYVDREIEIWALRNQSAIRAGQDLTDSLIEEEKERLDELEAMRISASDTAFANQLISEQEHELQLLQIKQQYANEKLKIDETYEKQRLKIQEAADKITEANEKAKAQAKYDLAAYAFNAIAEVTEENTVAHKAATTALMAIDTYKGALAAYASMQSLPPPAGPIAGGIAAAAVVAMGAKSIQKVWQTNNDGVASLESISPGISSGLSGITDTGPVLTDGGLVTRNLQEQNYTMLKKAMTDAMIEAPQKNVLITDQVTAAQKSQSKLDKLATP